MFAGIILNYMLDSIPQFLPERLASSIYHWFIGVIFSATVYRYVMYIKTETLLNASREVGLEVNTEETKYMAEQQQQQQQQQHCKNYTPAADREI
jgi:amino acid permease